MNGKLKWRENEFRVEWRKGKKTSQGTVPESEIEPGLADEVRSGGGLVDVEFELPKGNPARVRKPGSAWKPAPPPPPEPARRNAPAAAANQSVASQPRSTESARRVGHRLDDLREVTQLRYEPRGPRQTPTLVEISVSGEQNPLKPTSVSVAEKDTLQGTKVVRDPEGGGRTYIHPAYNRYRHPKQGRLRCYPYNFVQQPPNSRGFLIPVNHAPDHQGPCEVDLPKSTEMRADKRGPGAPPPLQQRLEHLLSQHPEMRQDRLDPTLHTGEIHLKITLLSPTVLSHPPAADGLLHEDERKQIVDVYNKAKSGAHPVFGVTGIEGGDPATRLAELQRIRPSAQRAPGEYHLPATGLKGPLRAVLEAYSQSHAPRVAASLDGRTGHEKERLPHRLGDRLADATARRGIQNRSEVTVYTYGWTRYKEANGPYNKRDHTWIRWVKPKDTPYAKLRHLDAERNPNRASLACRLFGRVSGDAEYPGWAGRVFIRGARAVAARSHKDFWFLKTLTRPTGAQAKCEAIYLMPDGAQPDASGTQRLDPANATTARYDQRGLPRGRKMYWPHSLGGPQQRGALPLSQVRDLLASAGTAERAWSNPQIVSAVEAFKERVKGHPKSQSLTKSWLKPLLPGSVFQCSLRFTNLSDIELGGLLKAILLGNSDDGALEKATHCHRIGRAKPLGFGAVVFTLEALRLQDVTASYETLGPLKWHDTTETNKRRKDSEGAFRDFCEPWRTPVWDEIEALTRIPETLTDLDYWKNWSDFSQDNCDYPLPLTLDE